MKLLGSNPEKVVFYKFAAVGGLLLALLIGCYRFTLTPLAPPATNSFDDGDQGWRISEGGVGSFSATGGYPGGFMAGSDNLDPIQTLWYFIAPDPFLAEVRKGYGKTLRFDLIQSGTAEQRYADDVILTDGKTTLTFDTAYNPNTTWTSYSLKLDELSGWKKGDARATKADIQKVLTNLTGLRIRGEYRSGPDSGGLDNVAIF
ncbi:hypothetical protein GCM10028818_05450 [Spirosoma horti]